MDTIFNMSSSIIDFSGFSESSTEDIQMQFPDFVTVTVNKKSVTVLLDCRDNLIKLWKKYRPYASSKQNGDIFKIPFGESGQVITCTIYFTTNTLLIQGNDLSRFSSNNKN